MTKATQRSPQNVAASMNAQSGWDEHAIDVTAKTMLLRQRTLYGAAPVADGSATPSVSREMLHSAMSTSSDARARSWFETACMGKTVNTCGTRHK